MVNLHVLGHIFGLLIPHHCAQHIVCNLDEFVHDVYMWDLLAFFILFWKLKTHGY